MTQRLEGVQSDLTAQKGSKIAYFLLDFKLYL
jgi:hypothetical protein